MMTDPYKLFSCVFYPPGKSNNAEFRTVNNFLTQNFMVVNRL